MAPTHFAAVNMKQSSWSISQQGQAGPAQAKSVPIVALPIPVRTDKRSETKLSRNTEAPLQNTENPTTTLSPVGPTNPPNTGIYIPLHKLLRGKRQVQSQVGLGSANPSVVMLVNPGQSLAQNRSRAAQRVMFLMRQNPLYNVSSVNDTMMRRAPQPSGVWRQTTQLMVTQPTVTHSKPALQSLSNLNLVDLTFPLIARNDKLLNRSRQASANLTRAQIGHGEHTMTGHKGHTLSGHRGHVGTVHSVHPEVGLRGHMTTGHRAHGEAGNMGHNEAAHDSFRSTILKINTTAPRSVVSNQRRATRPVIFQVTRPTPHSNARILNLRLQPNPQPPAVNPVPSRAPRQPINRPVHRRPTPQLTIVQPVSGQRISSTILRTPTASTGRHAASTTARRIAPTITSARRHLPTARRTGDRTLIRARTSTSIRQPARRIPSTQSHTASRRVTSPRLGTRQRQRRPTTRRRTPPDPFTQRFSAGFQRGSTLLHQPPMDFTGFDGTRRAGEGGLIAGAPPLGFPGVGPPGIFGGGGGMFLGGPPGFL